MVLVSDSDGRMTETTLGKAASRRRRHRSIHVFQIGLALAQLVCLGVAQADYASLMPSSSI